MFWLLDFVRCVGFACCLQGCFDFLCFGYGVAPYVGFVALLFGLPAGLVGWFYVGYLFMVLDLSVFAIWLLTLDLLVWMFVSGGLLYGWFVF